MGKVKTFCIRIQGIEHIVEVEELNGSMHSSPAVPSSPVHTVAEPVPPPRRRASCKGSDSDGRTDRDSSHARQHSEGQRRTRTGCDGRDRSIYTGSHENGK